MEYLTGTRICYDDKLLPIEDVMARLDRDEDIKAKYEEAEAALDEEQYQLDEVDELLDGNVPTYDDL